MQTTTGGGYHGTWIVAGSFLHTRSNVVRSVGLFLSSAFRAKAKSGGGGVGGSCVCVRAPRGLLWFDDERRRLDVVTGDYKRRWEEERASKGDDP